MPKKTAAPALSLSLSGEDKELLERVALAWRLPPQRVARLALRCFDSFIPPDCQAVLVEEAARLKVAEEHLEIWAVKGAAALSALLPFDLWEKLVREGAESGVGADTVLTRLLDAHYKIKRAPANVGATRAKEKGYDAPYFNAAWRLNGEARARYLDALWQLSAGRDGEPSPQTQINQAVGQALERVRGRLLDAGVEGRIAEGATGGDI